MSLAGEGMSCALAKLSVSSVPRACSRVFETRSAVSHRQHGAVCRASMTETTKKSATFEETALGAISVIVVDKVLTECSVQASTIVARLQSTSKEYKYFSLKGIAQVRLCAYLAVRTAE